MSTAVHTRAARMFGAVPRIPRLWDDTPPMYHSALVAFHDVNLVVLAIAGVGGPVTPAPFQQDKGGWGGGCRSLLCGTSPSPRTRGGGGLQVIALVAPPLSPSGRV